MKNKNKNKIKNIVINKENHNNYRNMASGESKCYTLDKN